MKNGLKLLVDPVFTTKNIDKCSTTWWLTQIAKHWVDQGDNRYVYFTTGVDGEYDTDSLTDKRFIKVPIARCADRYREMWLPPDDHMMMFNAWAGIYGDWDALLTTRNNGFYWHRLLGAPFKGRKFIVLAEPFPFLPFKKTYSSGAVDSFEYRKDCIHTIGGYLMFDKVHINTEYERQEIFTLAKTFFAPSEQKHLRADMDVTHPKNELPEDYVYSEEAKTRFMKRDPMWLIYPQRMDESERQFSKVFKSFSNMYSMLNSSGLDLKMQICTNSTANMPEEMQADSSFLSFGRPARAEFWEKVKDCGVFISFAIEEGLPFSLLECVKLGTLGVVNRAKWSEDFFGKDYPWLIRNVPEAYACVRQIYEKPEESWKKFINWYRNYFQPVILAKGDSAIRFEEQSQKHFSLLDKELVSLPSEELIDTIEKECPKSVDLLSLPNTPAFRQGGDLRDRNTHKNGIYFRMPKRWIVSYALRFRGWKSTSSPWVLER